VIETECVQRQVQCFVHGVGRAVSKMQFGAVERARTPTDEIRKGVKLGADFLECFHGIPSLRGL
jgi:hypothetical protein